jgi:succinate dehydrogenase / fumarate reductase membrane anchor subunit
MNTLHKTDLKIAQGLGSAKSGVGHWKMQRLSAIALIPLVIWFVILIVRMMNASEQTLFHMLRTPYHSITAIIFLLVSVYHGTVGMREVIEDYVHCKSMKFGLIIVIQLFSFFTAIAGACAVLVFHLSTLG